VSQKPFGSWTRAEKNEEETIYYRSRTRRRLGRGVLALIGVALILLSVGLVFADIRSVGEGGTASAAPKSERLRLTIPTMKRVRDIPVYDGAASDKSKLAAGVLHLQDTDFPWEKEANVYIAGHRLGFPNTNSHLAFWDLNKLEEGDEFYITDSEGRKYTYKVFNKFIASPENLSVLAPVDGKNIVTLQTCTLPDYTSRLLVRGELQGITES
jgi:sortase A